MAFGAEASDDLPISDAGAAEPPAAPAAVHSWPRRIPDPVTDGRVVPAADYIGAADVLRGPPPPLPVRVTVDNAVRHTQPVRFQDHIFSAWVGAPYYVPGTLQFPLRLPCGH